MLTALILLLLAFALVLRFSIFTRSLYRMATFSVILAECLQFMYRMFCLTRRIPHSIARIQLLARAMPGFVVIRYWSLLPFFPGEYIFAPIPVNILRARQNGRHFPDDIFRPSFLKENARISIQIWFKFVPRDSVGNTSALVQVMAWRRTGAKPLREAMLTKFTDEYMCHQGDMS